MEICFNISKSKDAPAAFEELLRFPSKENEQRMIRYLGMANNSIKVCMYNFSNPQLMNALIDAKKRGCRVQVIMDKESLSTIYIHELASAGVECTHHNLSNTA